MTRPPLALPPSGSLSSLCSPGAGLPRFACLFQRLGFTVMLICFVGGDDDDVNMLFDGISSVFDSLESKESSNTDMEEEAYEAIIKKESRKKRKNSEQKKQFMELLLLLKLKFDTKHRTLLTGTPLQNNLDDLFMLIHFLDALLGRIHKSLTSHLLKGVGDGELIRFLNIDLIPQSTDYKYPLNCDFFLRTNYVNIFCSKRPFCYVFMPQREIRQFL
ncbi:unnamed protein product [Lactuca virosa]|uniref:SNF2 N-terminal domain-containing protein n=1 Tax=Lactuca virosa TaxID=75947 RepID=A0AAU9LG71_9ASTR|nr:unnamed protein product [Lactuca virosa]